MTTLRGGTLGYAEIVALKVTGLFGRQHGLVLRFRNLFSSSLLPLLATTSLPLLLHSLCSSPLSPPPSVLESLFTASANRHLSYQASCFVPTFGIYLPRVFLSYLPGRNPVSSRCLVRCFRCSVHSLVSSAGDTFTWKGKRLVSRLFPFR